MNEHQTTTSDKKLQKAIGKVLRWGVWTAMAVCFVGGIIYLLEHGQEPVHYPVYQQQDQSITEVIGNAFQTLAEGKGQGIILLGVLLLFATPLIRLLLSLIGFILEKDRLYIAITIIVLLIIFTSIQGGIG